MRYFYNENAFNDNTEECYYFLGFIFADGCLQNNGEICININVKDEEILNKFKKYLQIEKPLSYYKKTNSCRLSFGNKRIVKNLMSFGLTPRKSLTIKFPNNIPQNMIRHFMRGYFDGDGCVSIKKGINTLSLRINLVGTYEFLTILQDHLIQSLGIKKLKISNINIGKNTYQLNIQNKTGVEKIKKYFYYNSTVFLNRKREIFFIDTDKKIENRTSASKYRNVFYRKRTKCWGITYYKDKKRLEKSGFKTEIKAYNELCKIKNG
jgi:hypothetical protein